jgi:AraC-like DNA-binding protein
MTKLETERKERLVGLLGTLAIQEGFSPSILDGVQFIRANDYIPRHPVVYDPSIVIVGQGRKRGYLGDEVYTYDAYNYLVLSVPLPLECETEASPEKPLLGVQVQVTPATLGELLVEMDDNVTVSGQVPRGIYSTPLSDELIGATIRLLECLHSNMDGRILGPQVVREIIYRVLCGGQGAALRAVATRQSSFSQIARILKRIHMEYPNSLDMETLAKDASMSLSTFHHNFKAVTSTSPLQYLKSIRLHRARILMVQDGLNASTAAGQVGYESASQFSREFKRFFGNSPADETAKMRAMVGLLPTALSGKHVSAYR